MFGNNLYLHIFVFQLQECYQQMTAFTDEISSLRSQLSKLQTEHGKDRAEASLRLMQSEERSSDLIKLNFQLQVSMLCYYIVPLLY